ncbi:MAG: TVP38/TMEM64 family protein [Clostridia bacterium]|nr:TVP38/TMEM64 family protein [Clostridia bacterium]
MDWSESKKKKILGIISVLVLLALGGLLSWLVWSYLSSVAQTPTDFKNYIESFGWTGRLIAVGIQILQVVIALIPGELVEIGMGYAFGPWEGTLLCLFGTAAAACAVFLFTKKFGVRMVEWFVPHKKIDELRIINSDVKLKRTVFLLFFLPGTPKDLFVYFFGLTRIRLPEFLIISTIARIPSVVSSTVGGTLIGSKDYLPAVILFAVTGGVSVLGLYLYNVLLRRWRSRKEKKETAGEKDT